MHEAAPHFLHGDTFQFVWDAIMFAMADADARTALQLSRTPGGNVHEQEPALNRRGRGRRLFRRSNLIGHWHASNSASGAHHGIEFFGN